MTTPYGSNFVPGEGPTNAVGFLIGEGPGRTENLRRRPFCGASGQLLDMLLRVAGLDRSQLYITNLVKFHVPDDDDPTEEDIERDWPILAEEIDTVRPQFIGLVGRISARHFLGDIDMEWAHGLAFGGGEHALATFMPLYHPAYGLYLATALPLIQDDFQRFAELVKGGSAFGPPALAPTDQFPAPRYQLLPKNKKHWPAAVAHKPVYLDTEGSAARPWGLSYTQQPGTAWVVLRDDKVGLAWLRQTIEIAGADVVLHNALHDIPVLRAMGIEILRFRDTMVRAHHLCLEPQGLKPLARRHAGMQMESYEEVVGDARRSKHLEYFRSALGWLDKHYPDESPERLKAQKSGSPVKKKYLPSAGKNSPKTSRTEPARSLPRLARYRKRH